MDRYLFWVDRVSAFTGKAIAWAIVGLTVVVCYDVTMRYVVSRPTQWAFDWSYILYGTLFMVAGAYTLSRDGHVRGDLWYRALQPSTQAGIDLALYVLFFLPGIAALIYAGVEFTKTSWAIREVSSVTASGTPIYPFKLMIPLAGALLLLQGFAEMARCVICLKTGQWPRRLHDVEEGDIEQIRALVEGDKQP